MKLHQQPLNRYILLIFAIAIGSAGCATNPVVTPDVHSTSTAMMKAHIWKLLEQRPVHVPTVAPGQHCPTTNEKILPYYGFTPGHEFVFPRLDTIPFASAQKFGGGNPTNNGCGGQKEVWLIQSPSNVFVLIRGHQLDAPNPVRFNGGIDQSSSVTFPLLSALRLEGSDPANWTTYTRLRAPGCYIYQVDGLTFSEYLIFQATVE